MLAALLGFIGLGGIGHIYAGRIRRGVVLLVVLLVTGTLAVFFWIVVVPAILHIILVVWTIYDARNVCKEYNTVLADTGRPPW